MKSKHPNFSNLIGVPYNKQNCLKLAQNFYKVVFKIELKHYCEDVPVKRSDIQNLIYSNKGDFQKIDSPQFGDLILLRVHGLECHIGIYIDADHILHASRITGSILDKSYRWKTLIGGYYRLKETK